MVGGSPAGVAPETLLRAAACAGKDGVAGGAGRRARVVVAVDRGLDALLAAGIAPDLFCGDADSVSVRGRELVERAEAAAGGSAAVRAAGSAASNVPDDSSAPAFEVERYNPHKDFTDLSLALRAVRERWGDAELVLSGFSGGNPDHYLGVLGRLAGWLGHIELVEDGFRGRILHAGEAWEPLADGEARPHAGDRPHRFSFIPIAPEGAVVSETGMRWELDREQVELLSDLGISNVVEDSSARIACHEGCLICWLFD